MPRMEIRIDFVVCFLSEIAFSILSLLDDPADLIRASAVSHSWRNFVISNSLLKNLCLRKAPMIANVDAIIEEDDEIARVVDRRFGFRCSFQLLEKQHYIYKCLLEALSKSLISPKDCVGCAVGASSTNRYPNPTHNVLNVIIPLDIVEDQPSYWSSQGQRDPNMPETLLLQLDGGICIVTEIDIQPFEEFLEAGNRIYSAKSVRFRMGHPRSRFDLELDLDRLPLQNINEDKYVWTYTSPEFPMAQERGLQPFKLPEPVLCIGGYLEIELLGRTQCADEDGLYYLRISHVRILGHSLKDAFDLEMLPSESIILKYCPDAIESVLEYIPKPMERSHEDIFYDMYSEIITEDREMWLRQADEYVMGRNGLFFVEE